jgi:hypothetical protein
MKIVEKSYRHYSFFRVFLSSSADNNTMKTITKQRELPDGKGDGKSPFTKVKL